jgi:PAS domain-containing protein
MFETMSEPMQEFLDRFPGPVLVMDPEENVLAANQRAIEISAVAPDQIRGMKCGNVLKCQQAEKPEGCSRSDKCRCCIMLQAMRYSHSTGLPRVRIPASPEFEWLGDDKRTVIYVSSEKIGDLVILTLEETATED